MHARDRAENAMFESILDVACLFFPALSHFTFPSNATSLSAWDVRRERVPRGSSASYYSIERRVRDRILRSAALWISRARSFPMKARS